MSVKVGINGFGRIGRNVFRAANAAGADIEFVAVNDLTDTGTLANLLKYDSILGRFPGEVSEGEGSITVDGTEIKILSERDPADLGWGDPFILAGLIVWNDFFNSLIFLGGSTTQTLPVAMYTYVGGLVSAWNKIFAVVIISMVPILAFYMFAQKQFIQGFAGGLKG
jgi:hypothetical protein